ncbi:MAG: penicillin-binding protein [Chitinophagales bacterium]
MNTKKEIVVRVYLVFALVILAAGSISFQVLKIQVKEGPYWISLADSLTTQYVSIEAERGNLLTENGGLLATSLPYFEVRVDWKSPAMSDEIFQESLDSLSLLMAHFQGKSKQEVKRSILNARKNGNRYYLLAKNLAYPELQQIKSWPLFNLGRYKGGLIVLRRNKRVNPYKMLAHRTIGYVRDDILPVGLEGSFDEYLTGIKGKRLMQKIAGGTWIPVNEKEEISPQNGKDVVTTIDINLQDVVENALLKAIKKHKADHGTAVLMEVKTGKIRAIANIGAFENGNYWEKYNYAVGEAREPGSTFKTASMIALLEDGYVELTDSIDLNGGAMDFYDKTMRDSEEHELHKVTVKHAFEISSNVGISKLIDQHYNHQPEKFIAHLKRMGLTELTGIEIKGEAKPYIKEASSKEWTGITLPWMAVGYELTLTPLQILNFYNALANDGLHVKPSLVSAVQEYGKDLKNFKTEEENRRICSKATLKKIRKLMEGVVENGTAEHLQSPHYKMAGKTGTALIAEANRGYNKVYQASFVGYFPADEPVYSCIVSIAEPQMGVYYGGWVAGPVFKEVADKIYSSSIDLHEKINREEKFLAGYRPGTKDGHRMDTEQIYKWLEVSSQINTQSEWMQCVNQREGVVLNSKEMESDVIPDVRGMGLRDAIYLLENLGLEVKVQGRGRVYYQSVRYGTPITQGREIVLKLT